MRLIISLFFTTALGMAGWMAGGEIGGRQGAQLLAMAGVFLASMILMATRAKPI
jgi:hypothetical protein